MKHDGNPCFWQYAGHRVHWSRGQTENLVRSVKNRFKKECCSYETHSNGQKALLYSCETTSNSMLPALQ